MGGGAEPPLEARARDLQGVGAGAGRLDGGVVVEDRGERLARGRDGVEVDAALAVDDDPDGAAARRAGRVEVVELEAERAEDGLDRVRDRCDIRHSCPLA